MGEGSSPAPEDVVGGVAHTAQSGGHDGIVPQRPTGSVHRHVVREAEDTAQEQLLVGEGGLELGQLDGGVAQPGGFGRDAGGR